MMLLSTHIHAVIRVFLHSKGFYIDNGHYLHINGSGVLHHSLHHSTDVPWLDGVDPVSSLHTLSQHLGYDQALNLSNNKREEVSFEIEGIGLKWPVAATVICW
jgi:hypothetical protein